jgi:hypothetical protein
MRKITILTMASAMFAVACSEPSSPVVNSGSAINYVKGTPGSGSSAFDAAAISASGIGELVVTWKQGGIGNNDVDYRLAGERTLTWACYNGGDNHPKAQNKTAFTDNFEAGFSRESTNGQISSSFTLALPASPLFCPAGQVVRLARAAYSNVEFGSIAPQVIDAVLNPDAVVWP